MEVFTPTHRHIRSGGLYRVVVRGHMEADYPATAVVVYDDPQGRVFVRPSVEFDDGRFAALADHIVDAAEMVRPEPAGDLVEQVAHHIAVTTCLSLQQARIAASAATAFFAEREREAHPDDRAVDLLADAMKAKLAKQRAKGYGGWDDPQRCPVERLAGMLIDHLAKGDPVDVANFTMMLFCREGGGQAMADAAIKREKAAGELLRAVEKPLKPSQKLNRTAHLCSLRVASLMLAPPGSEEAMKLSDEELAAIWTAHKSCDQPSAAHVDRERLLDHISALAAEIADLNSAVESTQRQMHRWVGIANEMGYEPNAPTDWRPKEKWLIERCAMFRAQAAEAIISERLCDAGTKIDTITAELSQAQAELAAMRAGATAVGDAWLVPPESFDHTKMHEAVCAIDARALSIRVPERMRAGAPDGWRLVPSEPTQEMIEAGRRMVGELALAMRGYMGHITDENRSTWPEAYEYRAMVAAAPQPPVGRNLLQAVIDAAGEVPTEEDEELYSRMARKLTLAEFRERVGTGPVFNDTDPEAAWIEASKHACPHCGGSGHKDDVSPAQPVAHNDHHNDHDDGQPVAVEVRPLVWRQNTEGGFQASGLFGDFHIVWQPGTTATLYANGLYHGEATDVDAAKLRAQTAESAAILSAINARPVDAVKAGALREMADTFDRLAEDCANPDTGVGYQAAADHCRSEANRLDPKGGA